MNQLLPTFLGLSFVGECSVPRPTIPELEFVEMILERCHRIGRLLRPQVCSRLFRRLSLLFESGLLESPDRSCRLSQGLDHILPVILKHIIFSPLGKSRHKLYKPSRVLPVVPHDRSASLFVFTFFVYSSSSVPLLRVLLFGICLQSLLRESRSTGLSSKYSTLTNLLHVLSVVSGTYLSAHFIRLSTCSSFVNYPL